MESVANTLEKKERKGKDADMWGPAGGERRGGARPSEKERGGSAPS